MVCLPFLQEDKQNSICIPVRCNLESPGVARVNDFIYGSVKDFGVRAIFFPKNTLKCLNIGTPKTFNFPFVPNGKLMIFRCPSI